MGSDNFFSKVASVDPLAQALHLPGATKYAQQEAQNANNTNAQGPYAGVTPTLAAANAGYAPGGPGANSNYQPFVAKQPGGAFGFAQRFSSSVGDTTPNLGNGQVTPSSPSGIAQTASTGVPAGRTNPYVTAAAGNPAAQAGMNPYAGAMTQAGSKSNTQPVNSSKLWGIS